VLGALRQLQDLFSDVKPRSFESGNCDASPVYELNAMLAGICAIRLTGMASGRRGKMRLGWGERPDPRPLPRGKWFWVLLI